MATGIQVKIMLDDGAFTPTKGTDGSAGYDLIAVSSGQINPGQHVAIATGVHLHIPDGYYGHICGRSGIAKNYGIDVLAGVIDSDYRGAISAILQNGGDKPYKYTRGDKVAQIIFKPHAQAQFIASKSLNETTRTGGFGSTGPTVLTW